jgi:uncharacterized sporulation protein YeaH/YhbH (DUF444 family)
MAVHDVGGGFSGGASRWYDLFSRGTRDWLRHNEKVRQAVRERLPDLISGSDVLSRPGDRRVQVPVRVMEHQRFRLRPPENDTGVGQGKAKPGDVLKPADAEGRKGKRGSGSGEGELTFLLEFRIDDILDWLWEELSLPNLKPKKSADIREDTYVREGWNRRGPRSRLDRRRTLKESIKRRIAQPDSSVAISDEDLLFHQLAQRRRPATNAVVFFMLDVSSSMDAACRRLAKTFFFWALQGIRRQYVNIETVFIAHTIDAWEFREEDFFRVQGQGGTVCSSACRLARDIYAERYDSTRYNGYLFYATDGHNFSGDNMASLALLRRLAVNMNFLGYAETSLGPLQLRRETEVAGIFRALAVEGWPTGTYRLSHDSDIWPAIRAFFTDQAERAEVH